MSTDTNVDANTVPDNIPWKQKDFVCSPAAQTAPLGGINEHSVDCTVVMNAPMGPDDERMVFIWGYPEKIPIYKQQGVIPVTVAEYKKRGLRATSASIDLAVDGLVYRDAHMVCLLWTTKTNYTRLMQNLTEAAEKSKGGRSDHYTKELENVDAYGLQRGVPHFTQDEFTPGVDHFDAPPPMVPMPGATRGREQISLSGPRMGAKQGSKED